MSDLLNSLPTMVMAIGGLGAAAYALVDASKALPGGGPSMFGFDSIQGLVGKILPVGAIGSMPAYELVLETLRSNWINGMPSGDQKNVARSMLKLYLRAENAPDIAALLCLKPDDVSAVARLWREGPSSQPGTDPSAAVVGRVDLALTAYVDGAYQRADQRYRNQCKFLAGMAAIAMSTVSGAALFHADANAAGMIFMSFIAGLIAVPLAPVTKDLASALQAGVKVAQSLRR